MPRNFLPGLPRNPPTPTAGFGGATRVWLALVGQSNAQGVYQSTTYTGTAVRSGCDVIYNGSTITAWDTVENGQPVDASAPGPAPHFIDALLDGGLGLTAATVVVVANGATFVTNVRTVQLTQLISTLISEGFDPDTDRLDCVFFSGEWEASAANSSAQIAADFQDDLRAGRVLPPRRAARDAHPHHRDEGRRRYDVPIRRHRARCMPRCERPDPRLHLRRDPPRRGVARGQHRTSIPTALAGTTSWPHGCSP